MFHILHKNGEVEIVESFAPYWRGSRASDFGPHFGSREQVKSEPKLGPIFRSLFLREMVVIRVYGALVDTILHGESSRIFLEGSEGSGNESKFGNGPVWAPISSSVAARERRSSRSVRFSGRVLWYASRLDIQVDVLSFVIDV